MIVVGPVSLRREDVSLPEDVMRRIKDQKKRSEKELP
jgi:hypothetical protein